MDFIFRRHAARKVHFQRCSPESAIASAV